MNNKTMQTFITKIAEAIADPEFRARKNYVRPPFIFWGPAGSGKTKAVEVAGTKIKFPVINVRLGQEPPEDMSYPDIQTHENGEKTLGKIIAEMFPVELRDAKGEPIYRRENVDGEIVVTDEPALDLERLSKYIENFSELKAYYENLNLSINDAPGVILFLDEVNRIEDKMMFQMIFQLFDSGKFKGYELPANVSTFGACNPSKGYIVSNWFEDPAFANRCIHFKTSYDVESWLEFAKQEDSGYSDVEIQLVETYPAVLFNEDDNTFDIPKIHRSFRNMSFLSNYVTNLDWEGHDEIKMEILSAVLGGEFISSYQNVVEDVAEKALEPLQILKEYDEYDMGSTPFTVENVNGSTVYKRGTVLDNIENQPIVSKVREKFITKMDQGLMDYQKQVTDNLAKYIIENVGDPEFEEMFDQNRLRFIRFILDLPKGNYAVFMRTLLVNQEDKGISNLISRLFVMGKKDPMEAKALLEVVNHFSALIQKEAEAQ